MAKRRRGSGGARTNKRRRRGRRSIGTQTIRRYRKLDMQRVVPNSKLVRFKYAQLITLDPATDTMQTANFRANSIWQPDYGLLTGNHKPLGYDEWKIFYDHYAVVGSKITATFLPSGGGAESNSAFVGVHLRDTPAVTANLQTMIEQENTYHKVLTNAGATSRAKASCTYSAKKFLGIKDIKDNITRVGAQMTANPAEDALFQVWAGGINRIVNPGPINILVEIYFTALLTERKDLATS